MACFLLFTALVKFLAAPLCRTVIIDRSCFRIDLKDLFLRGREITLLPLQFFHQLSRDTFVWRSPYRDPFTNYRVRPPSLPYKASSLWTSLGYNISFTDKPFKNILKALCLFRLFLLKIGHRLFDNVSIINSVIERPATR